MPVVSRQTVRRSKQTVIIFFIIFSYRQTFPVRRIILLYTMTRISQQLKFAFIVKNMALYGGI